MIELLIAAVAIPALLVARVAIARAGMRPTPGRAADPDCLAHTCGGCARHASDNASTTQERRQ